MSESTQTETAEASEATGSSKLRTVPGRVVSNLSLIHISEPTRQESRSSMPNSA